MRVRLFGGVQQESVFPRNPNLRKVVRIPQLIEDDVGIRWGRVNFTTKAGKDRCQSASLVGAMNRNGPPVCTLSERVLPGWKHFALYHELKWDVRFDFLRLLPGRGYSREQGK